MPPTDKVRRKITVIRLDEFFRAHGLATDHPRQIRPFHQRILDAFGDVIRGKLPNGKRNLMVLMPPRHGKTFLARAFVAYSLGCFPDSQFIYTGYSATIAAEQTTAILQAVASDWFRSIFPAFELAKTAADHFCTTAGGQVYGVGMGGSITGFGAGLKRREFGGAIVLDDPLKSDDARSETALKHCCEWYTGTLLSRKNHKDTPVILIMQRLHPGDLAGHIMDTEGEKWHVIAIPGLRDDGTALWEETKSAADLKRLKEVDPFTFYAQYQQQPQIEGGNIIKKDWWRYHDAHVKCEVCGEEFCHCGDTKHRKYILNGLLFITADTAMKTKTMNDYTELQVWHATGQYLDLLDEEYGRWEFPEMLRRAKALWNKWKPCGARAFYIEDKVSGTSLGQTLCEQGIPAVLWKPQDYDFPEDKVGRVKHSTWFIEAGRVRLPLDRHAICRRIIEECAAFNGDDSVNDDAVDALTIAVSVWSYKGGGFDVKAG
jgi:predicted phage terminase large subunit-like protein